MSKQKLVGQLGLAWPFYLLWWEKGLGEWNAAKGSGWNQTCWHIRLYNGATERVLFIRKEISVTCCWISLVVNTWQAVTLHCVQLDTFGCTLACQLVKWVITIWSKYQSSLTGSILSDRCLFSSHLCGLTVFDGLALRAVLCAHISVISLWAETAAQ